MEQNDPHPIELRTASLDDLPFIMATERRPGYDQLVGRSEREGHLVAFADTAVRYLIGSRGGRDGGFAVAAGLHDPHGNVLLRRIAVHDADSGFGLPFVSALIDWAFEEAGAHRCWLDTFRENARARHVYMRAGMREDGLLREAYRMADGARRTLVLFSILRPEWEALRMQTPRDARLNSA